MLFLERQFLLSNVIFFFIVNDILFSFCLQLKLWEFKMNILASELLIDIREVSSLCPMMCFIQMNLYEPAAIQGHLNSLAYTFT